MTWTSVASDLRVSTLLPEEARRRIFAEWAAEQIAEVDAAKTAAGLSADHTVHVDGRAGAPLTAARDGSVVVANWPPLSDLVARVHALLVQASPVASGTYAGSHVVFVDGVETDPAAIPPEAQEVEIVNTVVYARKIERGQSAKAPGGVYEAVAADAKRLLGNQAQVKFTYRSLAEVGGSGVVDWARGRMAAAAAARHRTVRQRNPKRQFERDTRNPALIIRLR